MSTTITSNDPTIVSERSFKDLDLNFTAHPIKKDVSMHYNEKAVINSVKNLVSTNFYERPFQPFLGSNIRALLFELVDSVVAASLERQITETINNHEPRVSVQSINAIPSPDENGYKVILTFFIVNNPNPVTINFFLERIR
jgi:phage baseplate assembly protein W|tara:strand:- start:128 stop:550 length:423 start_codon:yes stop_codon:yes gene_type:complete